MGIRTKLNPMGGSKSGGGIKIESVACTDSVTWVIDSDGNLYGCGLNDHYQQGSGNTTNVRRFTKRATNVKEVICTNSTTWYIDNNNNLYRLKRSEGGALAAQNVAYSFVCDPTSSSGYVSVFYEDSTNNRWYHGSAQMGTNSVPSFSTDTPTGTKGFWASYNTRWYINSSNKLYGQGVGNYGQQGSGSTSDVSSYTQRATGVTGVCCSDATTWYINTSSQLYGCGWGASGQQGNNRSTKVTSFTQRATGVNYVRCTRYTTWYVDNLLKCIYGCGENSRGQQGNGDTEDVGAFTKRADLTGSNNTIADIQCSDNTTWYLTSNGDLYGCGSSQYGQQGNNDTSNVTTFTKRAENVKQIACSNNTTWYVTNDGKLYGCGDNQYGQQGNNTTSNVLTFENKTVFVDA